MTTDATGWALRAIRDLSPGDLFRVGHDPGGPAQSDYRRCEPFDEPASESMHRQGLAPARCWGRCEAHEPYGGWYSDGGGETLVWVRA